MARSPCAGARPTAPENGFEHAYTLGCQVGDPCWESVALRGRGLLAAARAIHASPTPWPRRRLVGPCDGSLKLVPGLVIRRCG